MPNSREFWERLGKARENALSGEILIASSLLDDLRDNYRTGDESIDGKRFKLLETIAGTCNIPFPETASPTPVRPTTATATELRALPGKSTGGEIVIDWSSDVPVRAEFRRDGQAFVINNFALSVRGPAAGKHLFPALERARETVLALQRTDALIDYERYLDLIAEQTGDPGAIGRSTLLDGEWFEAACRLDPSLPFNLIGAALSRLRQGDTARGRHLLRRLAGSDYPERRHAQRFLYHLLSGETAE
ncbi:hypothetical protein [Thalassovita aquimarina]|uniref:hypothetical protein n=1 Tax=Thalassovita aquimarina TaxID=2785917 RepID=UPI003568A088